MEELKEETKAKLENKEYNNTVIKQPYAFNLFIHNSPLKDNSYVEEEIKMINETKKIFKDAIIKVNATCIRVPIIRAHSEAINVEFFQDFSVEEAYDVLKKAEGVRIFEDRENNRWATPLDASHKDDILISRIRKDISQEKTFDIWVVGDQIRKGAALNAIQIAEILIKTLPIKN